MIPLHSAVSGDLVWLKIPRRCGHELKHGREIVASLRPTNFWRSEFRAVSAQGTWKIRRAGCLGSTEIVDSTSETRIAALKPNWYGGGRLDFSDGQTYRLTSKGFWRQVWTVLSETGQAILTLDSCSKTVHLIEEACLPENRLLLLTIAAWHMMKQMSEDAASVAALVATTS